MKNIVKLISIVLSLTGAGIAAAETVDLTSYRCGQNAIKIGMTPNQIQSQCGAEKEPVFISKHSRPALHASADDQNKNDYFEKWMYSDEGQGATHVLLKNGKVIKIFTNTTKTASQK